MCQKFAGHPCPSIWSHPLLGRKASRTPKQIKLHPNHRAQHPVTTEVVLRNEALEVETMVESELQQFFDGWGAPSALSQSIWATDTVLLFLAVATGADLQQEVHHPCLVHQGWYATWPFVPQMFQASNAPTWANLQFTVCYYTRMDSFLEEKTLQIASSRQVSKK